MTFCVSLSITLCCAHTFRPLSTVPASHSSPDVPLRAAEAEYSEKALAIEKQFLGFDDLAIKPQSRRWYNIYSIPLYYIYI
ncbi:hypothetical protein F4860DRAFT_95268 [Xylaria cubensis]|nr:hypothetical protein F4860DRAFT_95268 [Xylaria cubensis]